MDIEKEEEKCRNECKILFSKLFKDKTLDEIILLSLVIEDELGMAIRRSRI